MPSYDFIISGGAAAFAAATKASISRSSNERPPRRWTMLNERIDY